MPHNLSIGDFVGLEFEVETITSNQAANALDRKVWKIDHDASCESDGINVGNFVATSVPKAPVFITNNTTLGTEIVLYPPYCLETEPNRLLFELEKLTDILLALGEPAQNFRAGLHIHISMPTSLRLLKTYLVVAAYLEDLFFALGTQGYTFRGMLKNESAYCRPITQYGPPVVQTKRGWAQVFDIDSLLMVQNTTSFWYRYGNVNPNREADRYHPARYTWFNLYALLAHSTIEFRQFNTTLNPYLIWAEVLFCKAVCEYCLAVGMSRDSKLSFPQNSIFDGRTNDEILETYVEFATNLNLPTPVYNIIGDVISRAPKVVIPKNYIKTHLRRDFEFDFSNIPNIKYIPEGILKTVVVDDIHARHGERGPN